MVPPAACAVLQGAMDHLHEQNQANEAFQPVLSYTLNPKCVSMGELYGEYNPLTSEWKDGLASTLIRSAVSDPTPALKWVIFDGPVDAMWIENMNTVRKHLNLGFTILHSVVRQTFSKVVACP